MIRPPPRSPLFPYPPLSRSSLLHRLQPRPVPRSLWRGTPGKTRPLPVRHEAWRGKTAEPWNDPFLPHRGRSCRSEEHTSELQSPCNLVCRLLLEKKKITRLHHTCPLLTTVTPRYLVRPQLPTTMNDLQSPCQFPTVLTHLSRSVSKALSL